MSGKSKIIFVIALVMALGCFAVFLLSHTGKYPSRTHVLPDGSLLTLDKITFTNGLLSYNAKAVTGWRAAVADKLPRSIVARLGWSLSGGGLTLASGGGSTILGVFTVCDMATNSSFQDARLQVSDDLGNTFDSGGPMGMLGSFGGKRNYRVEGWVPRAFPRRGKSVGLRYFEKVNGSWHSVAEFTIPNPAVGIYPTWVPENLPATKADGDLSVTLRELKAGGGESDWSRPAFKTEPAVTWANFHVEQAGRLTNYWRPVSITISDATGNDWRDLPFIISSKEDTQSESIIMDGALWPGEAAWKLRVELLRDGDFAPEETCTFSNIVIPDANDVAYLNEGTNLNGTDLKLIAISGENAEQPGNLKWSTVKQHINVSVRVSPAVFDHHLTLVKVTDDSGHEAEIVREKDYGGPERIFAFKTRAVAKQLNLTFAIHKSRFVEFLAKPDFVRAN